jgi:hypothetical protein
MLIDFSGIPQYDRERQAWSNILSNIENIEDQELKENLFDSIKDWSQQFVILHREIDNELYIQLMERQSSDEKETVLN